MPRRLLALPALCALACHGAPGRATGPSPEPASPDAGAAAIAPVPEDPTPTLRLSATFAPSRYRAALTIDPASPTFHGRIEIEGSLGRPAPIVWLDAEGLTITRAAAGDVPLEVVPQPHDFVGLRAPTPLPPGPVTLTLEYDGAFSTTDSYGAFVETLDGDRYAYSEMEPMGARRIFPCVDEPGSKVPWELALDVPAADTVIGNTPVARETVDGDTRHVELAPTHPLPAYLIAFAVGPFELVDAGATGGGAPIRVAAFRGHAAETKWAVETTARIVQILEAWFGTPYPYEKLDLVPIPSTIGFGAMENAGMITYRGSRLLLPAKRPSQDDKRNFVWTTAHEVAHQWFGDSVTPAWWDDLWLNESFATWIEDKALATFSPAWGLRVPVVASRSDALDADGLLSARRLRQPIDRADDIDSAFDEITYDKGAAVLRMFERWVGADVFQAGVRAYLADHADGTATAADFLAALDQASPLDVTDAFRTFLDQPGAPRVGAALRCDGAGKKKKHAVVTLTQERWLPRGSTAPAGDPTPWQIPVCVAYGTVKTRAVTCTTLTTATAELPLDGDCPKWIFPNADGAGYYRMGLSADALDALVSKGWSQLGPHERVLVAGDVHAAVARGELPIGAELDLVHLLLRDGDAGADAIEAAVTFAEEALDVASDASRDAVRQWIRDAYSRRAKKLGFLPDKGDDADRERSRAAIMPLVAGIGGDPTQRDRAVSLAAKWRDLPDGARATVLEAAAYASADVRAALRADVRTATDDRVVRDLWTALGASDDATDAATALALLLDPTVDLRESTLLLDGLAAHPTTQPVAATFLRDHWDALLPRLAEGAATELVDVLTAACDAGQRDAIAAWAQAHVEPLPGGQRATAQALERLDQCVAARAAMGPELDAWLAAR